VVWPNEPNQQSPLPLNDRSSSLECAAVRLNSAPFGRAAAPLIAECYAGFERRLTKSSQIDGLGLSSSSA
jgi:flavin reductase (DIM6/NTAB) family NADH-FMN oxidoreductase RutF